MTPEEMVKYFGIEVGDAINRQFVELAASNSVTLTVPDYGEWKPAAPIFAFTPPNSTWPEIHIQRMLYSWRISEVEFPNETYARSWDYEGRDDAAFMKAVTALAVWQGNPRSEPTGWVRAIPAATSEEQE